MNHERSSDPCPKCDGETHQDSVDIGVGVIHGPRGCIECGWSEDPDYDLTGGRSPVQEDGGAIDQFGGYHPPASSTARAYRLAQRAGGRPVSITLADVRDALAARGLVALNIASRAGGGWQVSARADGSDGWVVRQAETIEEAVHDLFADGSYEDRWQKATRYFVRADGALRVTYAGEPPRLSDGGPFAEISKLEWTRRREPVELGADIADLL